MPSHFQNRYHATGFLNDAEKLLEDFIAEDSFEFKVFASVWRKHHFSLIYMGRTSERDLSEFTSEIFRISLRFLDSEASLLQNVGGVYLLYSLFRTQILNPPARIRVTQSEFSYFLCIRNTASSLPSRSLHYVIDYMIKNSFDFVEAPRLLGPMIPRGPGKQKAVEKTSGIEERVETAYKEFLETKILETVSDLSKELAEISEGLPINVDPGTLVDYTELIDNLDTLGACGSLKKTRKKGKSKVSEGIGSRRARIKAAAYKHQSAPPLGNTTLESDVDAQENTDGKSSGSPKKATRQTHGRTCEPPVPRQQKKLGRPKKVPVEEPVQVSESDSDSIIESILDLPPDLVPPECITTEKKKREKPKRKLYYL